MSTNVYNFRTGSDPFFSTVPKEPDEQIKLFESIIQPADHCREFLRPKEAEQWGFVRYILKPSDPPVSCSRGPSCSLQKGGKCVDHAKKCLPAFFYTHPALPPCNHSDTPTLVYSWTKPEAGAKTVKVNSCWDCFTRTIARCAIKDMQVGADTPPLDAEKDGNTAHGPPPTDTRPEHPSPTSPMTSLPPTTGRPTPAAAKRTAPTDFATPAPASKRPSRPDPSLAASGSAGATGKKKKRKPNWFDKGPDEPDSDDASPGSASHNRPAPSANLAAADIALQQSEESSGQTPDFPLPSGPAESSSSASKRRVDGPTTTLGSALVRHGSGLLEASTSTAVLARHASTPLEASISTPALGQHASTHPEASTSTPDVAQHASAPPEASTSTAEPHAVISAKSKTFGGRRQVEPEMSSGQPVLSQTHKDKGKGKQLAAPASPPATSSGSRQVAPTTPSGPHRAPTVHLPASLRFPADLSAGPSTFVPVDTGIAVGPTAKEATATRLILTKGKSDGKLALTTDDGSITVDMLLDFIGKASDRLRSHQSSMAQKQHTERIKQTARDQEIATLQSDKLKLENQLRNYENILAGERAEKLKLKKRCDEAENTQSERMSELAAEALRAQAALQAYTERFDKVVQERQKAFETAEKANSDAKEARQLAEDAQAEVEQAEREVQEAETQKDLAREQWVVAETELLQSRKRFLDLELEMADLEERLRIAEEGSKVDRTPNDTQETAGDEPDEPDELEGEEKEGEEEQERSIVSESDMSIKD